MAPNKPITLTPEQVRAAGVETAALESRAAALRKEVDAILIELERESTTGGNQGFTMPLAEVMTGPLRSLVEDIGKGLDITSTNLQEFGSSLVKEANAHQDADARGKSKTDGITSV